MALPSAFLSLSLLLGKQLMGTAPTNWTSWQNPVRPGPTDRCGPHEYWSTGHCCLLCPAGEYVREPCSRPHTRGQCEKCDRGTFTAFPNGLRSCLLCGTCPEDQVEVAGCTATSDRTCQCRPGCFYRAPGNVEFCMRCSTCPEGTVVLQQCSSTADTVCGLPGPESRHRLWLVGSFLCSLFASAIMCLCIKKPKDGRFQPVRSSLSNGAPSELEPLEERSQDRGESLGPESPGCSGSSQGTPEADPPGFATGDLSLSTCHLDLVSEAPVLPSIPESPAGVGGPQAAAVWRTGGQDDGAKSCALSRGSGTILSQASVAPPRCGRPPCRRSWSRELRAQATAK